MQEKEKQIMQTFGEIIPKLSENNKAYLLGLGEGMALQAERQQGQQAETAPINTAPTTAGAALVAAGA